MVDPALIRRDMEVVSSDGEVVGRTASVEQGRIRVSPLGGSVVQDIPPDWISRVDHQVHLSHSAGMLRSTWRSPEAQPFPTEGRARLPWMIGIVLLLIALFLLIWGLMYAADDRDTREPIATPTSTES